MAVRPALVSVGGYPRSPRLVHLLLGLHLSLRKRRRRLERRLQSLAPTSFGGADLALQSAPRAPRFSQDSLVRATRSSKARGQILAGGVASVARPTVIRVPRMAQTFR